MLSLACEVTDAWLYVGETEDVATDYSYTSRSICDTCTSYWFRAEWRAYEDGPEDDDDFHVEVHDMTEDVSVWEEDDIEDDDSESTQQVVDDVSSPNEALDVGTHELRAYAKRVYVGEWVQSDISTITVKKCTPGVKYARADVVDFFVDAVEGSIETRYGGLCCEGTGTSFEIYDKDPGE